jgi:hypothetical protein
METPTEFTQVEEIPQGQELLIVSERNFELIFNGKVDARIQEVERELKSILRKDVSDVKAYKDMKDLKNKVIVKMRTGTLAKSKEMTEGYKNNIAKIKEVESMIIDKVTSKLESKADAFIEKHEALIREESERIASEAKEKLDRRVSECISSGIVFNGYSYAINDINVSIQFLKDISDDEYVVFLSKVKAQHELNIAEIKRQDEEAKEYERLQEEKRKENEARELELKAREDELNARLKKMQEQEDAIARKAKEQEELEAAAEVARQEELKRKETERLEALLKQMAIPFENIGLVYSIHTGKWSKCIGGITFSVIKEDILGDVIDIEALENEMKEAQAQLDKEQALLLQKQEELRISLFNDEQLLEDYKSRLRAVQAPTSITNASVKSKLDSILVLIK